MLYGYRYCSDTPGRRSSNLGPSVSVCGPSSCGVSCTVGTSLQFFGQLSMFNLQCSLSARQATPIGCSVQRISAREEKRWGEDSKHTTCRRLFLFLIDNSNTEIFSQRHGHLEGSNWSHLLVWRLISSQNVHASWPLDVVFAVCSSASFCPRNRRRGATQKSVFFAVSSLNSIWCVRGFREHTLITETLFCYLRTMSSLINVDIQATKAHCTLDKNTPNKIWLLSSKGKGILGIHSTFQMTLK